MKVLKVLEGKRSELKAYSKMLYLLNHKKGTNLYTYKYVTFLVDINKKKFILISIKSQKINTYL